MLHGMGIFPYIRWKNDRIQGDMAWLLEIPVPWSIWDVVNVKLWGL